MQELLNHPAVQAGVAPFLAALIAAKLFQRIGYSGLAIIAGFLITVYMVSGFAIEPLTAPRKIILLGMLSALLGLLPLHRLVKLIPLSMLLPALGGAAAIWTVQRILRQQTLPEMLLWGAACAAYVAVLVWGMGKLAHDPPRAAAAATALGIGTGGAALVGASALLGQFSLALGAAAAAHWLIQILTNRTLSTGHVFTLPTAVIAGTVGCVAVLSASLPWYALAILAGIPIVARQVSQRAKSIRQQTPLPALATFAVAGAAIYVTWRVAGDVPF